MRDYFICKAKGDRYGVLDMQPIFRTQFAKSGQRFEYARDVHWNSLGHKVTADEILDYKKITAAPPIP